MCMYVCVRVCIKATRLECFYKLQEAAEWRIYYFMLKSSQCVHFIAWEAHWAIKECIWVGIKHQLGTRCGRPLLGHRLTSTWFNALMHARLGEFSRLTYTPRYYIVCYPCARKTYLLDSLEFIISKAFGTFCLSHSSNTYVNHRGGDLSVGDEDGICGESYLFTAFEYFWYSSYPTIKSSAACYPPPLTQARQNTIIA